MAQADGETIEAWTARLSDKQREDLAAWRSSHRWHPNQLRHSYATRIRKLHGLEAAQVLLGHSRADVTQLYAARNEELAVSVAAEVG